jgi:hypothetical protein
MVTKMENKTKLIIGLGILAFCGLSILTSWTFCTECELKVGWTLVCAFFVIIASILIWFGSQKEDKDETQT